MRARPSAHGYIWGPSLPQFQAWDRFREPVAGEMYPDASWRGDILIGSGTPNHVNDPIVSGLWRPQDRDHYFDDDPNGKCRRGRSLDRRSGGPARSRRSLRGWHRRARPAAHRVVVFMPIAALRDADQVVVTDFTTLVQIWTDDDGAQAFLWQP